MSRQVHVLPCGCEECDKGVLTLLKDCGTLLRVPYHAYLIEDPDATIMVDTGCSVHWKERHPKELLASYPIHLSEDEHLDRILRSIGFSPGDIDYVINTHLHYDHCGNNEMFPSATFIVNETELAHALSPGWWESAYIRAVFDLPHLKYEKVRGEFEVTPGVKILPTPGHTVGHQSVMIELENSGTLVLAGDSIYLRENLETPILGMYTNANECAQSMAMLKHIVTLRKGTLLLTHSREYLTPQGWKMLGKGIQSFN
jgi:glyoxylase-like metal-dependent hydrolase (beta-lactamase superfamily II)